MIKNLSYTKINSVNPLYLTINTVNRYIEEMESKYLILVTSDESKDTLRKYDKL